VSGSVETHFRTHVEFHHGIERIRRIQSFPRISGSSDLPIRRYPRSLS
jgi:hypothetical protein